MSACRRIHSPLKTHAQPEIYATTATAQAIKGEGKSQAGAFRNLLAPILGPIHLPDNTLSSCRSRDLVCATKLDTWSVLVHTLRDVSRASDSLFERPRATSERSNMAEYNRHSLSSSHKDRHEMAQVPVFAGRRFLRNLLIGRQRALPTKSLVLTR